MVHPLSKSRQKSPVSARAHCHATWPADTGLTYRDLLAETRYEAAIDLMQDTDNTITHIASLLGYSDPTHFARAFRRMTGVSPRMYRQQYLH